jgi:hypothetical protein
MLDHHMLTHTDFIESCNYRFNYGKYKYRTLWDVFTIDGGKYMNFISGITKSEYLKETIETFNEGIDDGMLYGK